MVGIVCVSARRMMVLAVQRKVLEQLQATLPPVTASVVVGLAPDL